MRSLVIGLISAVALVACSSSPPPTAEPEPTATPEPAPSAEAPPPEPTATASASAEAPPPAPTSTTPPPSGRPAVSYANAEKISETFGATPAAKLELGKEGTILRIPEYALSDGVLLTFMIDKKGKKAKGGAGTIFRLFAQQPPSESFKAVSSKGPKFELTLSSAKVGSPNLAIGEIKTDDKGKETVEWKVVAPAKKDDKSATFELTDFTNAYLQITSEAPSP
ncbi:MAG: hypothetical protein JNL21_25350 [Myxococcales bacterium]|nr:hypothetical protein [Myxococcales bacterium]